MTLDDARRKCEGRADEACVNSIGPEGEEPTTHQMCYLTCYRQGSPVGTDHKACATGQRSKGILILKVAFDD